MAEKKQKGLVSVVKKESIAKPPKKAPGNAKNLQRGNQHTKKLANGCTEREDKFIQLYVSTWCVSDSVRGAGYDCKNATAYGNELMKKPHIAKLIQEGRDEFSNSIKDLRNRLVQAYADVAFSDISDYMEMVKEKNPKTGKFEVVPKFKTTEALTNGAGKLIESIEIGKDFRVKLKLESKSDARLQLAKYTGEFFDRDNAQTKPNATVGIYIPDNCRGDVVDSYDEKHADKS